MDGLIGQRVGKYDIQAELGRGGMGIVYRGFDAALRRPVAIKVLPQQLTYDAQFVQRFQQEAILAASLRHPNIVTIHDVGEQAGVHYIVMEYLEGTTLEHWLNRQGPLPPTQAMQIIRQVAAALDYAHAHGVIHRDVKPANIMIGPDGRAILMDFGLVRAAEGTHLTRSGAIMGTPEYMSPEQALGQPLDGRSDVYSLGVVLYKMLTGKPPFSGTSPIGITHAHVYDPPPPLRQARPDLPTALEAVITHALAKRPAERFDRSGLLADAFAAGVVGGSGIVAAGHATDATRLMPPANRPLRMAARLRSRWLLWLVAACGFLAVIAIGFGLLLSVMGGERPTSTSAASPSPPTARGVSPTTTHTAEPALAAMPGREASDTPVPPKPTESPTPTVRPSSTATVAPTVTPIPATATPRPTATPTPIPPRTPTPFVSPSRVIFDGDPRDSTWLCAGGFHSECDFAGCTGDQRLIYGPYCRHFDYPAVEKGSYRVTLEGTGRVRAGATDWGIAHERWRFGQWELNLPGGFCFYWPELQPQEPRGFGFEIMAESLGSYPKISRIKVEYLGQRSCDQ